jgi:hypothetical protein
MEKLSRRLGTSVSKLRATYVHIRYEEADWAHIRGFGGLAPWQASLERAQAPHGAI